MTFCMEKYKSILEKSVKKIFSKNPDETFIKDILLDKYFFNHSKEVQFSKRIKQNQMKIGIIWQIAMGNYSKFREWSLYRP